MMEYNQNWSRWIKISAAKHFKPDDIHFHIEGFERDTDGKREWVEFRIDGPYIKEMTKGVWKFDIEINLLIVVNESNNAYRIEEIEGIVTKKFFDCLHIYKFGGSEADDNSEIGCMRLKPRGQERVITTNFGKIRPDTNQLQKSVEAHYEMTLN